MGEKLVVMKVAAGEIKATHRDYCTIYKQEHK